MPWRRLHRSSRRAIANLEVLQVDGQRFRVGPWRGDPTVSYLAPLAPMSLRHSLTVERAVAEIGRRGVTSIVTSALGPVDQAPFLANGFTSVEELLVLAFDLTSGSAAVGAGTGKRMSTRHPHRHGSLVVTGRAASPADLPRALEVDAEAFEGFWRLDRSALDEALTATAAVRMRVAYAGETMVGYAITGEQRSAAYLQRLAVSPQVHGQGVGRALVGDSIWWARRRHARTLLVNTQITNATALSLYESTGFRRHPDRLAVLQLVGQGSRSVTGTTSHATEGGLQS